MIRLISASNIECTEIELTKIFEASGQQLACVIVDPRLDCMSSMSTEGENDERRRKPVDIVEKLEYTDL